MFKIISNKKLADSIHQMVIHAPRVARSAKPGQFIILIIDEKGERIPLTIADYNKEEETVTIVVQAVGYSTKKLVGLKAGEYIKDFAGPLGNESDFVHKAFEELKEKKIIFVGGGVGSAPIYPQVKWFSERNIKTDVILGFKNKDFIILKEEFEKLNCNLHICTDDGSYGFKGLVTNKLKELLETQKADEVITIGPMIMMKFVSELTKKYNVKTIASLNTLMLDGTGMCGGCRVNVGGKIKFTCVDGPEFDAHLVDFDEAMNRQTTFADIEKKHSCRLDGVINE